MSSNRTPKEEEIVPFQFEGEEYYPPEDRTWRTTEEGFERLKFAERIISRGSTPRYIKYIDDFPANPIGNIWTDIPGAHGKIYVVQTNERAIKRCILMATDPGDLVLDPTCGGGTTAKVAEEWGRRWITIDTSRVAISLTRQRLMTSTYPYYKTKDKGNDPGEGLKHKKAPHVTLSDIVKNDALDDLKEKYNPILESKLEDANEALRRVDDKLRKKLAEKIERKKKKEGKRSITDADERRWILPKEGETWEHWEVPFDVDSDWPDELQETVNDYRSVWKTKMEEVNDAIAERSDQEILYDQPEEIQEITRVSGPFTVEAVMPPERSLSSEDSPIGGAPEPTDKTFDMDGSYGETDTKNADAYLEKMTHLMEKDGIRFMDNKELEFSRLNRIEGGTYLHAEGAWESGNGEERIAISFGPEHGPVTGKQVEKAMREAYPRGYDSVVFAGFSFDDAAQTNIQQGATGEIDFHMAHIRPDVVMEDLLYRPEKEQIFTVFGLPRTSLQKTDTGEFQIEMEGVDVYDPVNGQINATEGGKVAAWFLDTDYNGRTFCICQAFFPNTPKRSPWKQFKKDLSDKIDGGKLDRLSGTTSLPFEAGEHKCAAVKVIDPRGNEVMRVLDLS